VRCVNLPKVTREVCGRTRIRTLKCKAVELPVQLGDGKSGCDLRDT
jgi:hypothetical protein